MVKKKQKILLRKSVLAGVMLTGLDYVFHILYANPETLGYFAYKFILATAFAFMFYKKKNSLKQILFSSTLFAVAHGFYYRISDLVQGKSFFARVGDINLLGFSVSSNNFIQISLAWLVVHGGIFMISVVVADRIVEAIS